MPLEGAPHDLYMQLLACSSSQSVFAIALLRACHFCAVFFSQPSCPQFRAKYVLVSEYSTEQFSVTVPGGGR